VLAIKGDKIVVLQNNNNNKEEEEEEEERTSQLSKSRARSSRPKLSSTASNAKPQKKSQLPSTQHGRQRS
jgi:hypothetical protein